MLALVLPPHHSSYPDDDTPSLDSLLYFGREYGGRASQITDEAVNGGLNW